MRLTCLACTLVFVLSSTGCAAEKGLVAHWSFDEGSGTALHDRSGNGNDGTIKGAKWVKNGDGYALEFDGVDDCVDCGDGPSLDLREKASVMLWVLPRAHVSQGEAGIVGKKFAAYLMTQCEDRVYFYISGGPYNVKTSWRVGMWHHVAATYDGTMLTLYLDGRLITTRTLNKPIPADGRFWIARSDGDIQYTQDAHFRGRVTEIKVYDHVLTPEEIMRHARTTNITKTVDIIATPAPTAGKLFISLNRRGLGIQKGEITAHIEVFQLDRKGRRKAAVVLKGSAGFGVGDEAVAEFSAEYLQPGTYEVSATARGARGRTIGSSNTVKFKWPRIPKFPTGPKGARRLNNLVTELLNVAGPD